MRENAATARKFRPEQAFLKAPILECLSFKVYHTAPLLSSPGEADSFRAGPKAATEGSRLLRAIIFDFDGVLVDSEPVILQLTQQMAAEEGWTVTPEEYYRDYLALDDRGIVENLYQTHGRPLDPARRDELLAWKSRAYQEIIQEGLPVFPGAVEFVRQAAQLYPLAIASGSLRSEIEHLLGKIGLRSAFKVVVTAEDCQRSKPDPEVFLKTLAALEQLPEFDPKKLRASECLAIEDAPGGILAAHKAGIPCLALAHTRPPEELSKADWVFRGFAEVNLDKIAPEFH